MPANRIKKEPKLERRAQRQEARRAKTKQMSCRILIVCEGEKTEPNYFESFKTISNGSFVYNIEARGFGLNTIGVVNKAIELRDKAQTPYEALCAEFADSAYHNHNPCTTVHKLVLQLLNRDDKLIKEVMTKIYPEK